MHKITTLRLPPNIVSTQQKIEEQMAILPPSVVSATLPTDKVLLQSRAQEEKLATAVFSAIIGCYRSLHTAALLAVEGAHPNLGLDRLSAYHFKVHDIRSAVPQMRAQVENLKNIIEAYVKSPSVTPSMELSEIGKTYTECLNKLGKWLDTLATKYPSLSKSTASRPVLTADFNEVFLPESGNLGSANMSPPTSVLYRNRPTEARAPAQERAAEKHSSQRPMEENLGQTPLASRTLRT